MRRIPWLISTILLLRAATFAQTGGQAAAQTGAPAGAQANVALGGSPARTLPHDQHDGVTLSADPYSEAARAKDKFPKADPYPVGILPVEVFLRNDTDQPLQLDLSTVELEVLQNDGRRQTVDWLTLEEVADAIAHPKGPSAPSVHRFPVGIPIPGRDKKVDQIAGYLRPFSLDAEIIPPKGAIHGFLFFDVAHDMSVVAKSSLYVPDVAVVATKKPLIFFEVPLGSTPAP